MLLLAAWAGANFQRLAGDEDALIRIVLVTLFAALIIGRRKPEAPPRARRRLPAPVLAGGAVLLVAVGLVFRVHHAEWLGVVILLYACLRWALPPRYHPDVRLGLFLLYWMHPLPGQLFNAFTLWMQLLSVRGAEWLLHMLNVPVWAHGFYLRTGTLTLGIPEACSGMRTAVTVSLCTLGTALLFRFNPVTTVAALVAGALQVLALNMVRIAAVVILAPRMPREWAQTALHDTLGVFLLITILLVQLEVSGWRVWRDRRRRRLSGIANGVLERPDRGQALPGPWRFVKTVWKPALLLLVVGLGIAFAVYKRRPLHRLNMMRPVIDLLVENDAEAAELAVQDALRLAPDDRDLLTKKAHVLMVRRKYAEVLALIERLPPPLQVLERVIQSRALMALGRADEGFAVAAQLADLAAERPGVAMMMAEYGAMRDRPQEVNRYLDMARRARLVQDRVRALFPYLAMREQWQTIVSCDNPDLPYADVAQALVAVQANLRERRVVRAAEIMRAMQDVAPTDPRFLGSLFSLALSRAGSEWEDMFAANLRRNIGGLHPDRVAAYVDYAFRLARPDLAWLAWLTLQRADASDPALDLSLARFGTVWFSFRRHQLGIRAQTRTTRIDLRALVRQTRDIAPFSRLWDLVPHGDELAVARPPLPSVYLDRYFTEMQRREAAGALSERLELSYPAALGMAGRYAEAHERLNAMLERYPARRRDILYQRAAFFNQQGRWQDLYETLVAYRAADDYQPRLGADLMFVNAMMNLNMGVSALEAAEEALSVYPGSPQVHAAVAAIWDVFGFKDQALHVLRQGGDADPRVLAQLLYDTGRVREAERLSSAHGAGILRNPAGERDRLAPPPAELTLVKRWPPALDAEGFRRELAVYVREEEAAQSPFVRDLRGLSAAWCRAAGEGDVGAIDRWEAAGRTEAERAVALHYLGMLAARQGRFDEARAAVDRAVTHLPHSAILLRVQNVLHEGDADLVLSNLAACPGDPDLWLAALVVRWRRDGGGDWIGAMVREAAVADRFSALTLARAADFLFRAGAREDAATTARLAIEKANGLLTPTVVGLRCALATGDAEWALSCALSAAELARDPGPFFKVVVMLKWGPETQDADLVQALEYLQQRFPEDTQWAERLGFVYFEKQDTRRALSVLGPVIDKDRDKVQLSSLLLAAEAARLEGDTERAVEILEAAYALHPDRVNVLNNLIYTLLENPGTVRRARELLPLLLELGEETFPVLDTAAMVYLRSGQADQARSYMERALGLLKPAHSGTMEVTVNAAEVYLQTGDLDRARTLLESIWELPNRSPLIETRARELLRRLEQQLTP